jgi:two-component system chemotaxis sensor kinase CheA
MNGYEFAQAVKALGDKWQNVPLVAMSSHASPEDLDRGKAAGFNSYIAKFDREALLKSISQLGEVAAA